MSNNNGNEKKDKRPDAKPRKHALLYQAYRWWATLTKLRGATKTRVTAIERGKSALDADFEAEILSDVGAAYLMELGDVVNPRQAERARDNGKQFDLVVEKTRLAMIEHAKQIPAFEWMTSIRGLGEGAQAAKVLALIDDIGNFDTISKLWRFSGYATYQYWVNDSGSVVCPVVGRIPIRDGKPVLPSVKGSVLDGECDNGGRSIPFRPDPPQGCHVEWARDRKLAGFVAPYNTELKSTVYIVSTLFLQLQTPLYVDIYYQEKAEQERMHPELTKGHRDNRALRKVSKIFLQHLWLVWREGEGLPVSEPYVQAVLGHTNIIEPVMT